MPISKEEIETQKTNQEEIPMFKAILNFFKKIFSSPQVQAFESWCEEVFTAEKVLVLASLKAFALDAVATAESTGFDTDVKRRLAFQEISAKAQTAGIIVGASMIGLAIEMALQAIKNQAGNKGNVNVQ